MPRNLTGTDDLGGRSLSLKLFIMKRSLKAALWILAGGLGISFVAGATVLAVGEGGQTLKEVTLAAGLFAALAAGLASASTLLGNRKLNQMAEDIGRLAELTESSMQEARALKPDPTVAFLFDNGRTRAPGVVLTRRRQARSLDFESIVSGERKRALATLPELAKGKVGLDSLATSAAWLSSTFNPMDKEHRETFDGEVRAYERALQQWLPGFEAFLGEQSRVFALHLGFDNRGRVPARDVVVQLHFPDGFEHIEQLPRRVAPPSRPVFKRRSGLDYLAGNMSSIRAYDLASRLPDLPDLPGNVSDPEYRRGSLVAEIHIEKLLHGVPEATKTPITLRTEAEGTFDVPWAIHAENLAEPASGTLVLEVKSETIEGPAVTTLDELLALDAWRSLEEDGQA
jgi:hypothetical protein